MMRLGVILLMLALAAAIFGFEVVANSYAYGAKVVFAMFLLLAVLLFLGAAVSKPPSWKG